MSKFMDFCRGIPKQAKFARAGQMGPAGRFCLARKEWMDSITRLSASLISIALVLGGCVEPADGYGFEIHQVKVANANRKLIASYDQQLRFSREARDALDHGVTLTVRVELELRDATNLTLLFDDHRDFELRYLPMLEDYEVTDLATGERQAFPRLRHALNALGRLNLQFDTGPLAPGIYEVRARTRIDKLALPAPMRLPTRFSPEWQHDSRWSTWPFEISV